MPIDWLALLPTFISAVSTIKAIVDEANSHTEIVDKITSTLPHIAKALEQYGGDFFPDAKPQLRIAAAAMTAFDPNVTKWVQKSLNLLLDPSPNLVVDGSYGPKTKAAVRDLQIKLGLVPDGWAGQLTQTGIQIAIEKLGTK